MRKTVVIIGGGASGMMCALRLKQKNPDLSVIIIEKNERVGKKLLKTGNGRCNLSNIHMKASYYNNPGFLRKCFAKYSVSDITSYFSTLGLLIRNDGSGRLYPHSETATSVLEIMRRGLYEGGIVIECGLNVISMLKKGEHFFIDAGNKHFIADYVVLACGSLAQAGTNGYDLAQSLGHSITALLPGLVPLITKNNYHSLNGLRMKCGASIVHDGSVIHKESGEILFKNDGISGILALNLSRHVKRGSKVILDLTQGAETDTLQYISKRSPEAALAGILPKMLALEVCRGLKDSSQTLYALKNFVVDITDRYDFKYAQITLGGVHTEEINDDFSSRKTRNLYIIGEMLNIDGPCGGYNLHFAWISALIAADSIGFEK